MAIDLETEVVIARPPADVFAQLIAVERWPEWLIASGIVRVERTDAAGPLAAGATLWIDQRVAGRSTTLDARVTALEPDARFAVAGRDADGITVGIDAHLVAAGATTRLRWHLRVGLPLRFRFFESMAKPQVERAARLDLEAFRQRLDATGRD
jgi:uncharacterized protein YndB with AHSA1/START domain